MIRPKLSIILFLALTAVSLIGQGREFPSDSIYQLDIPLTTQDQRAVRLPALSGKVQIVTMFYGSCTYVCPMTIQSLKNLDSELNDLERSQLRILLVSIDPERDTVDALKSLATKHKLDTARWSLVRANSKDVRKIAAVLGVQYRQLENKEFNHSTLLSLISPEGKIVGKTELNGGIDSSFRAELKRQLTLQ
jgi:protein SCO1